MTQRDSLSQVECSIHRIPDVPDVPDVPSAQEGEELTPAHRAALYLDRARALHEESAEKRRELARIMGELRETIAEWHTLHAHFTPYRGDIEEAREWYAGEEAGRELARLAELEDSMTALDALLAAGREEWARIEGEALAHELAAVYEGANLAHV